MANGQDTTVAKTTNAEGSTDLIPAIADKTLIELAGEAEQRLDALNKIKRVALKLTNRHDWVDEAGRPYLQASGAEKIARLFGVSWRIFEPTIEELDGGHCVITYKGEFSVGGATIEAIGSRSSKDGFFKKYKWVGEEGTKKERVELPASEIDRGDVKKSAYTNLLGNGITRLLGLRNLTYADLQEFAEIKQADVTTVEYKRAGQKPSSQAGKAPSSGEKRGNGGPSTPDQCNAIQALLDKKGETDAMARMQKVTDILGLKQIPTALSKLTYSQAVTVIAALQKEIDNGDGQ